MKRIAILGSTGSIGCSTLSVVESYPDRFQVSTLAAGNNAELAFEQAVRWKPRLVSLADEAAAQGLQARLRHKSALPCKSTSGQTETACPPSPINWPARVSSPICPRSTACYPTQLGSLLVLSCPSDNAQIFQQTGLSYFWNTLVNGQDADHLQVFATAYPLTKIPLVFDKQSFHATLGSNSAVNFLYADGHTKNYWTLGGAH